MSPFILKFGIHLMLKVTSIWEHWFNYAANLVNNFKTQFSLECTERSLKYSPVNVTSIRKLQTLEFNGKTSKSDERSRIVSRLRWRRHPGSYISSLSISVNSGIFQMETTSFVPARILHPLFSNQTFLVSSFCQLAV